MDTHRPHRAIKTITQLSHLWGIHLKRSLIGILLLLPFALSAPAIATTSLIPFPSSTALASLASPANPAPSAATAPSSPSSAPNGSVLFETHCSGCHPNGNNIIRRGKTLKLKAMKRQQVDSVDAIATLITQGKGIMSAYSDTLTIEEIDAIAAYVWEKAQTNWKG